MRTRRIGFLPGRGHLYPAVALARALNARGHTVTFFNRGICRAIVQTAGVAFEAIETLRAKCPTKPRLELPGTNTLEVIYEHSRLVLEKAPNALLDLHIEALLVDQSDPASGSVADYLQIPFITVCLLPPLHLNEKSPPFIFGWRPGDDLYKSRYNRRANQFMRDLLAPTIQLVNEWRKDRGLGQIADLNDAFSKHATITQLPEALDFPDVLTSKTFFYTGPFQDDGSHSPVEFPWHKLNGKPLIYASMGTVRYKVERLFHTIAKACSAFDVQLVISVGGMDLMPEDLGDLPGEPIVVHYAPQTRLLDKAQIAICHGGINSSLEALSSGIPIIIIPIADDQPGTAARIECQGLGLSLPIRRVSVDRLKVCIRNLLTDPSYSTSAQRMRSHLKRIDGASQATDIIEHVLSSAGGVHTGEATYHS